MNSNSEKLRNLVLRKLIDDVQGDPQHWAETILSRLEETGGLVDYLDLSNISEENRTQILEELGFDPREAEEPTTSEGARFDVVFQEPLPETEVEKLRLRYREIHGYAIKSWVIEDLTNQIVLHCDWVWLQEAKEAGATFKITGAQIPRSNLAVLADAVRTATGVSSVGLKRQITALGVNDNFDIEIIPG